MWKPGTSKRTLSKPEEQNLDEQAIGYSDFALDNDQSNDLYDDTYQDYNISPEQNAELAKVLIETDSYINRIQLTLENKYLKKTRIKKGDKTELTKVPTQIPGTRPLANPYGVSQIMGRIKGIIHHAMALGNIDKMQYGLFMQRFISDFVRSLIAHRIKWGIAPDTLRDIRRIVVDGVQIFITRPVGNIERGGLTKFVGQDNNKQKEGVNFVDTMKNKFGGTRY